MPSRCHWVNSDLSLAYHDAEWGYPIHDDRTFFEFLILEGAQAGLSWETILKKRATYRTAFDNFDPHVVATYDDAKLEELLGNAGIVRNRLKVASAVTNAQAFLQVQAEYGTFDAYVWSFVGGIPRQNAWRIHTQVPATSAESNALSKALVARGFKFVGSTICYAFMQATGLVNDHTTDCFRYSVIRGR